MQAAVLRSRCGCTPSDQKAWVRDAVLLPLSAGAGPGIHADYDEANVVAAAIALRMKHACVVVSRYAAAFAQLHAWLRARSALEWHGYLAVLDPTRVHIVPVGHPLPTEMQGFVVGLQAVHSSVLGGGQPVQRELPFGLRAAG
jgi:hypothetical protein